MQRLWASRIALGAARPRRHGVPFASCRLHTGAKLEALDCSLLPGRLKWCAGGAALVCAGTFAFCDGNEPRPDEPELLAKVGVPVDASIPQRQPLAASYNPSGKVGGNIDGGVHQREPFAVSFGSAGTVATGTPRERRGYYRYVIIGASTTANAAIESILLLQPDADILLLTDGDVPSTSHADAGAHGRAADSGGGGGGGDGAADSGGLLEPGVHAAAGQAMSTDLLPSYNEWRRHITCSHNIDDALDSVPVTVLRADKKHLRIDTETRRVFLDDSHAVGYGKCLIAPPGKPRKFYVLDSERSRELLADAVNTLGSLEDFEALATLARDGVGVGGSDDGRPIRHVTVIGGGFLGSEVALALARLGRDRGMEVAQVYAEKAPMQRLLPGYLALQLQKRLEAAGVRPIAERLVTDFRLDSAVSGGSGGGGGGGGSGSSFGGGSGSSFGGGTGDGSGDSGEGGGSDAGRENGGGGGRVELVLQAWDKRSVETDHIVLASTHIEPDTQVARASGLEIDQNNGGIVVNGQFEAVAGVYAAGGVASYYDPALGRRRIDRYDHSVNSGLMAGYNMAAAMMQQSYAGISGGPSPPADLNGNGDSAGDGGGGNCGGGEPRGPHPRLYTHQPMFRSHLADLDIVIEGVGEIDARLRTVGMWVSGHKGFGGAVPAGASPGAATAAAAAAAAASTAAAGAGGGSGGGGGGNGGAGAYRRGVVYYLRGDRVAGILLWNTTDLLERARDVVRCQPKIASIKMLKRQIPLAPDDWLRLEETPGSLHYGSNEVLTPPF